jgi:hypothetical protein
VSKFHIGHTCADKCLKLLRRRLGGAVLVMSANDHFHTSGQNETVRPTIRVVTRKGNQSGATYIDLTYLCC